MSSLNKVILIGNIGSEPAIRYTTSNVCVANFSVATTEFSRVKNNHHTEWHSVVAYDKVAEIAQKYIKKGDKIYIEGKLKTSKYTDKNGIGRSSTQIVVNNLLMLNCKNNQSIANEKQKKRNYTEDDYRNKGIFYYDDVQF